MEKYILSNPRAEVIDISDEIPFAIYGHWKGYWFWDDQSIAEDILNIFIPFLQKNKIKVLISTHKDLEGVAPEYMDWIQNSLIPKCMEVGMCVEIIINSEYDMGNISLDIMYEDVIYKSKDGKQYLTPNVNNLEEAKLLAKKIIEEMDINS